MSRQLIEIGKKYKNWLVIEYLGEKSNEEYYLCTCLLCNNNYEKSRDSLLRKNNSFSCASCANSKVYSEKADRLIGQVFGRLTIISKYSQDDHGIWFFLCRCSCGTEKVIRGASLKNHDIISCGCYHSEIVSKTHSGENSHFWKGGTSSQSTIDRGILRKTVNPVIKKESDYTCQNCNKHGGTLNCHHIYDFSNYPELRFEKSNLIVLCKTCHDNFHKIYPNRLPNTLYDLEIWMNKEYKYRNQLLEKYTEYYS